MRTSSGHPGIGTFFLPRGLADALTVVGVGVMVYAFILLSRRTSADTGGVVMVAALNESTRMADVDATTLASRPETNVDAVMPASKPQALSEVLPPPITLPDGRAIYSCSVKDIVAIHRANTTDQTSRLLVGRWVKLTGTIGDNRGKGVVYLDAIDGDPRPFLVLQFVKGWEEHLSTLGRGSSITSRGQIVQLDITHIYLERCELV